MPSYTFNYIVTIHNKQDLIESVMMGLISSCGENSTIYPVLDGCTDDTEKIIDGLIEKNKNISIKKIYAPDVHEIKSINLALKQIPQKGKALNITLQDDVILSDKNLEENLAKIYDELGFENVGTLSFRHGTSLILDHRKKEVREKGLIESCFGVGMSNTILLPYHLVERMVSVRSPECISSYVLENVGYLDEALAPYTWDNHDLSIRCLKKGLRNFVFALPFVSDVQWGGMRTNPHPEFDRIQIRNKQYLYNKHHDFLMQFKKTNRYLEVRLAQPFLLTTLITDQSPVIIDVIKNYQLKRSQLLNSKWKEFYIDVIRKNLRDLFYTLLRVKRIFG
ncbi:glycosyltransferase family 2 protein [Candidatus Kaiserbacteria bacterium]|nr:MAG: glycosyltransferase family 2 protein [Candidatus Kaiserbacteria bacterium]